VHARGIWSLVVDELASAGIVTLQNVIAEEVLCPLPDEFGLEHQEFERLNAEEFFG
jgi:predicted DsbA family dithiol-disulfide isomerase